MTITAEIAERIRGNLALARRARHRGERDRSWQLLEKAHVLSQPWASRHVRVHAAMLGAAVHERSLAEIWGQLVRLVVAGPGSVTGRYPAGNTGRADVPATRPMAIADDLAAMLDRASRR